MKKSISFRYVLIALTAICLFFSASSSLAQSIAINQNSVPAHTSAMLDVSSTSKGLLIPRLTTNQRTAILTPATGLLVYDTDINSFMFFNGSAWVNISSGAAPATQWNLQGNSGTNGGYNFIGTTDNMELVFKTNNIQSGLIDPIYKNYLIGENAGISLYAGYGAGTLNVAIGHHAMVKNKIKNRLIAIGDSALFNNGIDADYNAWWATKNIAIGSKALYANTTGEGNTAIGFNAMQNNTMGYFNTALGVDAMKVSVSGTYNSAVGAFALSLNQEGDNNTAFGFAALRENTMGNDNSAFGTDALNRNETGHSNSAFGRYSLYSNTLGAWNTAIGEHALVSNDEGLSNTAIGSQALSGNGDGDYNTGIGAYANVGSGNLTNATAIGYRARVETNNSMVLGSINGVNNATTSVNVGIGTTQPKTRLHIDGGSDASYGSTSGYLVTGDIASANIVMDDNEILARNNGQSSPLFLQVSGGSVKIGGTTLPSYQLELSTNSAGKPGSNLWTITSDARLKKDIKDFKDGLSIIKQVNPVWFRYNGEAGIRDTTQFVGILAQDIKKIAPYMVGEYKHKDEKGIEANYFNYDGNAMTYILINAIKEQQVQIELLTKQNEEILKQLNALKKE